MKRTDWMILNAPHTKREESVYGVFVFLLEHGTSARDSMKASALSRQVPGSLVGRAINTGLIPEAMKTYTALCDRRAVTVENRL